MNVAVGADRPRDARRFRVMFPSRALFLWRLVQFGKPVDRGGDILAAFRAEVEIVLGQRKLLQRLVPGLMHAFIFWGFLVLFPTIVIALIGAVDRGSTLPWLGRQGWLPRSSICLPCLFFAGVAAAVVIRTVQRPDRFAGSHVGEAYLILGLIAGIVVTLLPLACLADRDRAERVAGRLVAGLERALAPLRLGRSRACSSASSSGRTWRSSSASSPTCRIRSTCTSRPRR